MNILVTLNRGYLTQLTVMLCSLVKAHKGTALEVYVVHNSLTELDFEKLTKISPDCHLHSVVVGADFLAQAPVTQRYPKEMYYRIFAAQLLPPHLDRILYLDPDLVVLNSLEGLYQLDMGQNLFAAASHLRRRNVSYRINRLRLSLPEGASYVNSGVMLLNLEKLRQREDEARIFDFISRHRHLLILPDQDVLNAIYGGEILPIDTMKYNLSERVFGLFNLRPENWGHLRRLDWVRKNACIIHYCGRNKPWKENYIGEFDCFYHEFERLAVQQGLIEPRL